jgi:aldehyde dehydrogenase (NAD+)
VLSIISCNTVEEAIEIANDTVYGLGAHVQGTDMETVRARDPVWSGPCELS